MTWRRSTFATSGLLSPIFTPTIKISSRDSGDSWDSRLENILHEQRLTVHSQFLLACGEQLHPCYQENLIEVEVKTKLKKIFHRNVLELWTILNCPGFKVSHNTLLAWWIRTAITNMATFDRTGFEKLLWQFLTIVSECIFMTWPSVPSVAYLFEADENAKFRLILAILSRTYALFGLILQA